MPTQLWAVALAALCAAAPAAVLATTAGSTAGESADAPSAAAAGDRHCLELGSARASNTVLVPAGTYRPFFKVDSRAAYEGAQQRPPPIAVPAFRLDAAAVTHGEFLRFVCQHPAWRRSNVKAIFAEARYLAGWAGDLDPGSQIFDQPVTHVSWFAARAFCAARNARLPTLAEWERAGGGSEARATQLNEQTHDSFRPAPFRFAMGRPAADLAHSGLTFAGVWEWTADFNSVAAGNSGSGAGSSLFCGDGLRANDAHDYGAFLRYSFRSSLRGNYTLKNLGFRCAEDLAP